MNKRIYIFTILAAAAVFITGCGGNGDKTENSFAKTQPLVIDNSRGSIEAVMSFDPGMVDYKRDIIMSLKITAPSSITVAMPDMTDRVNGFVISGQYDKDPLMENGKTTTERTIQLTPLISEEHRIAPMAVSYTAPGGAPGWFATRPVVLSISRPNDGKVPDDITADLKPVWIFPGMKMILTVIGILIAAAGAVYIFILLAGKIKRKIRIMRMSPKERALYELAELMAKNLIGKHLVKEFYLELTMIVRRYIERSHKVRAPEQTTEEFLEAVGNDPRFSGQVLSKLRDFLQAADLVKFAAYTPSDDAIGKSTATAREYIVSDYKEVEWMREQERLENESRKAGK